MIGQEFNDPGCEGSRVAGPDQPAASLSHGVGQAARIADDRRDTARQCIEHRRPESFTQRGLRVERRVRQHGLRRIDVSRQHHNILEPELCAPFEQRVAVRPIAEHQKAHVVNPSMHLGRRVEQRRDALFIGECGDRHDEWHAIG